MLEIHDAQQLLTYGRPNLSVIKPAGQLVVVVPCAFEQEELDEYLWSLRDDTIGTWVVKDDVTRGAGPAEPDTGLTVPQIRVSPAL